MKKPFKVKYKIKDGLGPELYDTYGDNVIQKIESNDNKKITFNNKNNFVILYNMKPEIQTFLIKQIGFTYFGYLLFLINSLDYTNCINFDTLKKMGISVPMIKIVRKKLKDAGIIKKFGVHFYLNPEIAVKGNTLPSFITEIFPNQTVYEYRNP